MKKLILTTMAALTLAGTAAADIKVSLTFSDLYSGASETHTEIDYNTPDCSGDTTNTETAEFFRALEFQKGYNLYINSKYITPELSIITIGVEEDANLRMTAVCNKI